VEDEEIKWFNRLAYMRRLADGEVLGCGACVRELISGAPSASGRWVAKTQSRALGETVPARTRVARIAWRFCKRAVSLIAKPL